MDISAELRKKVDDVYDKFEEFKQDLIKYHYTKKQRDFFRVMENLHAFLARVNDEEVCEMVTHSERYHEYEDFFRNSNDYFMRAIETVQAIDIISKKVGVNSSLLDLISEEFLREVFLHKNQELRLLDFKNAKKIILVGSGPFPDTSLYVYENTKIPEIIGLDNNQEAVYISSQFIECLGFNNRIHIECIDGCKYNYDNADIIYIAGFVPPKHQVLEQIAKTSTNPNVQILVDSTSGMKKILFEDINEKSIHKRLKIQEIECHNSDLYRWKMIKLVKYDI